MKYTLEPGSYRLPGISVQGWLPFVHEPEAVAYWPASFSFTRVLVGGVNSHRKTFQFCNIMLPFLLFPKLKNLVGFRMNSRGGPSRFFGLPIKLAQTGWMRGKAHFIVYVNTRVMQNLRVSLRKLVLWSHPSLQKRPSRRQNWRVWVVSDVWRSPLIQKTANVDFLSTTVLKKKVSQLLPWLQFPKITSTIYSKDYFGAAYSNFRLPIIFSGGRLTLKSMKPSSSDLHQIWTPGLRWDLEMV